jgi:DNA polymerase
MSKWTQLLDVYDEIAEDQSWDHLRQPGIVLVRGDGPETAETAKVMVVGEAPGARENGAGKPFVGASGAVLDQLMKLAGLARDAAFVTNVVKYRPPGTATPNPYEVIRGQEALRKEFRIIQPRLTLLIGRTAHDAMHPSRGVWNLGTAIHAGLCTYRRQDGQPYQYVMSMYHPAFGLRNKKMQPAMEQHWEQLGVWLREMPEVLG